MANNGKYWACPLCNVLVPLFRPNPIMWEKRIENHFFKCHSECAEGGKWHEFLKLQKVFER